MKSADGDGVLPERCCCKIADVTFSIRTRAGIADLMDSVFLRLKPFSHRGAADLFLDIVGEPDEPLPKIPCNSRPQIVEPGGNRKVSRYMSLEFPGAAFSLCAENVGRLRIFHPAASRRESESEAAMHSGRVTAAAMNALAAGLAFKLAAREGVLVHAAGVERGGNGYLFLAPSGGGKSTLSARSPEGCVLADDGVAIRKEGQGYRLYPTPFRQRPGGNIHHWSWCDRSVPFGSMFILKKGRPASIEPCDRDRFLGRMLWEFTHFFGYLPLDYKIRVFDFWRQISQNYPIRRLVFSRDRVPWALIQGRRIEREPE